jgi:hypothetical protein
MSEPRKQVKQIKIISTADHQRRRFIDRVNKENKALFERLEKVAPNVNAKKLDEEYILHKKRVASLKHKRYTLVSTSSTNKLNDMSHVLEEDPWGSTFDANSYVHHLNQQQIGINKSSRSSTADGNNYHNSNTLQYESNQYNDLSSTPPIKNMEDFRRQIITKKKIPNGLLPPMTNSNNYNNSSSINNNTNSYSNSSPIRFEGIQISSTTPPDQYSINNRNDKMNDRNDIQFQMKHEPNV